jgi:ABC-type multidrug transport system fused ATPase/permease subunit
MLKGISSLKSKLYSKFFETSIARSLALLNASDKRKIFYVILIQIFLGFLDLVAVAFVGVLGALSVSGIQSRTPGNRVADILQLLHLQGLSFQTQASILGVAAGTLLILRTFFSVFFLRKTFRFLSRRGADISTKLVHSVLQKSLLDLQTYSNQSLIYSVTEGVRVITLGIIGTSVSLISDMSLLLVMSVGLFVVDPVIAISTFFVFSIVAFVLYKMMSRRVTSLGISTTEGSIRSSELISEVLVAYRETFVRNRREYYAHQISEIRIKISDELAELAFIPNISKYIIEGIVVLGALIISAIQFYLQDASHAVATLAIFLASGTRIAPAVLRLQQGAVGIKGSIGTAKPTLDLIGVTLVSPNDLRATSEPDFRYEDFNAEISLENIHLKYPTSERPSLTGINLNIKQGETVALVGKSGAGKTSMVDVLLGVISPDYGLVRISGVTPIEAIYNWPGAISYVPQDVSISSGTILDNITLGFPSSHVDLAQVSRAVEMANLSDFISKLPNGLDTKVGERGSKLSGGQKQRIGIARALYTNPKLIVLDEATSALDGETELTIADALASLKGKVTLVIVAHRLSSVRHADRVVYVNDGKIEALGDFESVRAQVPDFDHQAQLMGL